MNGSTDNSRSSSMDSSFMDGPFDTDKKMFLPAPINIPLGSPLDFNSEHRKSLPNYRSASSSSSVPCTMTHRTKGLSKVQQMRRMVSSEPCTRRGSYRRGVPALRTSSPTDRFAARTPTSILRERLLGHAVAMRMLDSSSSTSSARSSGSSSNCSFDGAASAPLF